MAREKADPLIGLCIVVFYPLTRLLGRRRFEGLEQHRRGRIPRFLAKQDLWRLPVIGRVMAGAGQIPVYRGSAEAGDSLRGAERALAEVRHKQAS